MARRSVTVEDLPPLALHSLRDLDLGQPPGKGRHAHVSAASGVVRRGDYVYVIGDDELYLGVFRLTDPGPGSLAAVLPGRLPVDEDDRKEDKPDLEALTLLPPFRGHPYGALTGLGSGSTPHRDRGFVWRLRPDGSLGGEPRAIDLAPLYALLRREVSDLNVEGACVMGDRLWLLHRGNHRGATSAIAELSLPEVMGSLQRELALEPSELEDIRPYDLGELHGVRLAFSDATSLGGGLLVFTASAERDDGEGPDGKIRGSVVGTIDLDGDVRRLREIDQRFKVEGVHASIDIGVMDFLFVCDQDDPGLASPLLTSAMPLDAALEHDD